MLICTCFLTCWMFSLSLSPPPSLSDCFYRVITVSQNASLFYSVCCLASMLYYFWSSSTMYTWSEFRVRCREGREAVRCCEVVKEASVFQELHSTSLILQESWLNVLDIGHFTLNHSQVHILRCGAKKLGFNDFLGLHLEM